MYLKYTHNTTLITLTSPLFWAWLSHVDVYFHETTNLAPTAEHHLWQEKPGGGAFQKTGGIQRWTWMQRSVCWSLSLAFEWNRGSAEQSQGSLCHPAERGPRTASQRQHDPHTSWPGGRQKIEGAWICGKSDILLTATLVSSCSVWG